MRGKRFFTAAAVLTALLCGLTPGVSALEPSSVSVELRPSVSIVVDGTARTFYNVLGQQVHPIYYSGTHYLPVRAIGELMGKNVNWDGTTKTVSLTSPRTAAAATGTPDATAQDAVITVEQRPDISIVVDGVKMDVKDAAGNPVYVLLNNGTNYLPVRAIGELMGKTVSWNGQTRTITLASEAPLVTDADTFGPSGSGSSGSPQAPASGTAALLTLEQAWSIALKQVPGANLSHVRECEYDRDDCRYEGEICYNGCEYEFEVDARTGVLLEWKCDHHGMSCPNLHTGTSGHHSEHHH